MNFQKNNLLTYYHCTNDSNKRIETLKNVNPNHLNPNKDFGKPNALWLSYDDSWINEIYQGNPTCYYYEYKFDKSNMFVIDSIKTLFNFQNKFATINFNNLKYIDWEEVSKNYTGIIFDYIPRNYEIMKYINGPNYIIQKDDYLKNSLYWAVAVELRSVAIFDTINTIKSIKLLSKPLSK